MLLSQLEENQSALITYVNKSSPIIRRLYDMGFTPGQEIRCANVGLCKSPVAYVVRETKIALRKKDAMMIGVVL